MKTFPSSGRGGDGRRTSEASRTPGPAPESDPRNDPTPDGGHDDAARRLWALLAPYRARVAGLSVLIAIASAYGVFGPQFPRYVIDVAIPEGDPRLFLRVGLLMVGYYLVALGLDFASMYFSYAFTQTVIHRLRERTYAHMLSLPLARFTRERSGSLVSRVVSDVNALESMIQAGASRILGQLVALVALLVVLLVMNWLLALVAVAAAVLMALFTLRFQKPLRRLARALRARVGEMTAVASEAVTNVAVVKSFRAEDAEARRFAHESEDYLQTGMRRRGYTGALETGLGFASALGTGGVVLLGGWLAAFPPQGGILAGTAVTPGELTAFLLYLGMMTRPVIFVLNFNNQLQAGMAALERIDALLDDTPEAEGATADAPSGALELIDVDFRYPGASEPSLRGLSLRVDPGQTVALVGSSGAGKSTVARLLLRLYDPQAGEIRFGGRPLADFELDALRRAIAIVPQEPTLFSGSVRDNIRYARADASDAEVRAAAEAANALGFITALPQGFDTEIGERGVKLSGGQKQRVAIARAILKGAHLLVLDEATSSLDSESERVIQDALDGLFARRRDLTSVVIAHRLSTIAGADRIFVLEEGRVVEQGDHARLLAKGGRYARLWRLQAGDGAA